MSLREAAKRRARSIAALAAAASLVLSGCGSFTGIYDIPLPGGADLGDDPIELKVQFRNVLDLVPQSAVKINEVTVGRVDKIALADDSWNAEVTMLVNRGVNLPANALANIKQSSLLGEKYVELVHPPTGTAKGELTDAAVIPLSRTNRNVEIEEVLGAMSMLLNGGGIEQLNTITKELNNANSGNEQELKALLRNARDLAGTLDGQMGNIDRALNGLNRLSKTLNSQKHIVEGALDDLSPGMKVLINQRKDLTRMLTSLKKLSAVATDTIGKSKQDLVANLNSLRPILKNVADAGANLPKSLEILVSFPFADSAVDIVRGDYANLYADFDLDVQAIYETYRRNRGNPAEGLPIAEDLPLAEGELLDPNQLPEVPLPGSGTSFNSDPFGLFNSLSGGAG